MALENLSSAYGPANKKGEQGTGSPYRPITKGVSNARIEKHIKWILTILSGVNTFNKIVEIILLISPTSMVWKLFVSICW